MKKINVAKMHPNFKLNVTELNPDKDFKFDMQYLRLLDIKGTEDIYEYTVPADGWMHSNFILLAAAAKINFDGYRPITAIVHDSNFEKLPTNVKHFLTAHELGHIKNCHLSGSDMKRTRKILIGRIFGILPETEIIADAYASMALGKHYVLSALSYLIHNTNAPISTKIELLRRYRKISKEE